MKHRSVVANFIFKWADAKHSEQQVALFERSTHPNIRSYQGKYAPISGSIEDDDSNALAAAEREIKEETQLRPYHDIVLEFSGKSFSFQDDEAQRSWTVYPFSWMLRVEDSKIEIDWEHSGWQWFDPQDVLSGRMDNDCVPNLKMSLQRVYFGPNGMFSIGHRLVNRDNSAGRAFLDVFEQMRTDTKSGARQLATEALKGLLRISECFAELTPDMLNPSESWYALRMAAYHFGYSARPSMNAAINAAIIDSLSRMMNHDSSKELSPQAVNEILKQAIQDRIATSTKVAEALGRYIDGPIGPTASHQSSSHAQEHDTTRVIDIVTISSSSTIFAALTQLLDSNHNTKLTLNLTILESRPQCEGASLAASLLSHIKSSRSTEGFKSKQIVNLKLVPESHAALALMEFSKRTSEESRASNSKIVLLGADRITPFGHVVNKTGSAILATLSKSLPYKQSRKTIILSEEDKIAMPGPRLLEASVDVLAEFGSQSTGDESTGDLARLSKQELDSYGYEPHSAAEVYAAWPENAKNVLTQYIDQPRAQQNQDAGAYVQVEVANLYFEQIPASYIDVYISENGEISRKHIFKKSILRAQAAEKLFGNLYS